MPYVNVFFDPNKVPQKIVDKLKANLQPHTAAVLSSDEVRNHRPSAEEITTRPEEIFVYQHEIHPTDVNAAPLEIHIEAGKPKGRSGDKIVELLGQRVSEDDLIPAEYLSEGESCIFVNFHEHNGFGFIPKRTQGG